MRSDDAAAVHVDWRRASTTRTQDLVSHVLLVREIDLHPACGSVVEL